MDLFTRDTLDPLVKSNRQDYETPSSLGYLERKIQITKNINGRNRNGV